jgi:hypothetical protein
MRTIVLPTDARRTTWDLVSSLILFYACMVVPYRIGFSPDEFVGMSITNIQNSQMTVLIDAFIDLFFAFDIFFRLRHFAIVYNGKLMKLPVQIKAIYMHRDFYLDLVGTAPLDFLLLFYSPRAYFWGRFIKLIRLHRYQRYFDTFENYIIARGLKINAATIRFVKVTCWLLISR